MDKFDRIHGQGDSSDEEQERYGELPKQKGPQDIMAQKNQILMDRLIKA